MANFKGTIITTKGHALIAKAVANTATINFTRVAASSHDYTSSTNSDLEALINFSDIKQYSTIDKVEAVNTSYKVFTKFTNKDLADGYYVRAIGLFATDPTEGEILYSVTVAENADWIPADNGVNCSGINFDLNTGISNTSNVTLNVNYAAYATLDDIEKVNAQMSEKVQQVEGKGLSTNDYDNTEKTEVAKVKDKADIEYVNSQIQNMNSIVQGFYSTVDLLTTAFPTGNINNYVVTANNYIHRWNGTAWISTGYLFDQNGIADKSITPSKTSFQQINLSSVVMEQGYYIAKGTGTKQSNTSEYYASSFINLPFEGLTLVLKTCTTNDLAGMAFYDKDNIYISGLTTGYSTSVLTETEFTVPVGCNTMRFSCVGTAMLSGVLLAIKSNPIDTNSILSKSVVDKTDINSQLFYDLYDNYFEGIGTSDSASKMFENIASYGSPSHGNVTLGDKVININSASSQASGGCGFKIVLPKFTPSAIKATNAIQIEMDVTMQTPIEISCRVGIYAQKRVSGALGNSQAQLADIYVTLSATPQQHISEKISFTYEDIINKVVAHGDVTLDQIECFGIYVIGFSTFSNNIITFSNVYLNKGNSISGQLVKLLEEDKNLKTKITESSQLVLNNVFTNYSMPDMFSVMQVFSPTKGDVVIDSTTKMVTIDNVINATGSSPGIYLPLTGFYELIKTNGKAKIIFTGKASFNGSLLLQLYINNSTGNFAVPYLHKDYSATGETVELSLDTEITLSDLENFMISQSYDIATLDHLSIYLRAGTVSNNFDCIISELKFEVENTIAKIQSDIEKLSINYSGLTVDTEMPLDTIKPNGGLFSIFHNVAYIGDSLSSGEHEYTKIDGTTGYIDLFPYSYGQVIARATGTTALNLSSGGRTAMSWLSGFSTQAFATPANLCQAYIIYLGTNDMDAVKNPYGMGNVLTDIDVNNYANNGLTFAGQYATIIQRIKEVQPKAKIFCCTVPKSPSNYGVRATNPIISSITEMFDDVYLIDLFNYAETISNDYRLGSHLNSAGYQVFAWQVMSYIDFLIRKYPSEFKEVAFIGTDYHHA